MIQKGAAARDYYFDLHVDPSLPDDYTSSHLMQNTWGAAYYHGINPALWHGWKLTVIQEADLSGGGTPANYSIEFESPWDATNFTDTGAGLHEWWFRVYLDNAKLSGGCGTVILTFDELRLTRRDTEGGAETTLYTLTGPYTSTVTNYDPRLNCDFVEPTISGPYPSGGSVTCPGSIGALPNYTVAGFSALGFGFKYGVPGSGVWVETDLEFDNTNTLPGGTSCPCSIVPGDIGFDARPNNSVWVTMTASVNDQVDSVYNTTQHYVCASAGTSFDTIWYRITRVLETRAINATIHRYDGPMRQRQVVSTETCEDGGSTTSDSDTITIDDTATISLKHTVDFKGTYYTDCSFYSGPDPLPPCASPDSYVTTDPAPTTPDNCAIAGEIEQTWNAVFGRLAGRIAIAKRSDSMLVRAYTDGADTYFQYSDGSLTWSSATALGVAAECIALAFIGSKLFILTVEDGRKIKLRTSDDLGQTFTMPDTLSSGSDNYGVAASSQMDGLLYVYYMKCGDATVYRVVRNGDGSALRSETACTGIGDVDEGGLAACSYSQGSGVAAITLDVLQSGAVVQYTSTDGLAFV